MSEIILDNKYFNDWAWDNLDDYSNRLEVYCSGAGTGKSYEVTRKLMLKAMNEKRKVLVVRKVQSTIKDSVWSLMNSHLSNLGLKEYSSINKSDFQIELPNGSILLFKGLDDPEKIKSIDGITDILIEEATELNLDDFTQLNLRLRADVDNPQIYLLFNPVSKVNWVYQYFFENEPPTNTKITYTTYKDNKFLSDEFKQQLEELKERNPAYYRIYALGEFATLDKLVFPVYEKRIISDEEVKEFKFIAGLDFGYVNDASALVYGYYDEKTKTVYITGEYVKKGMLNDEIANTIISLGLQKEKIYADSAEPKSIVEIRQKGINIEPTQKGKDSVLHGIQWLQQCKIVIDERCFKTIEEFENYTWTKDKKTGEYINKPVDAYNHCIDALRYSLNRYIKGNQRVTFRKGLY